MKLQLLLFTFLFSNVCFAEETVATTSEAATQSTSVVKAEAVVAPVTQQKRARIYLGQSKTDSDFDSNMTGTTFGADYSFFRGMVHAGVNYVGYPAKSQFPASRATSLYLALSAVQFSRNKINFTGDIIGGGIVEGTGVAQYNGSAEGNMFYGAALTLNYNQEIGISLSRRTSDAMGTENTVALVGYY